MKKLNVIVLWMLVICILTGCSVFTDRHIPSGYSSSEEYMDEDRIQDHTDFCMYRYDSAGSFEKMQEYASVTEEDIEKLAGYFSDFGEWMEMKDRLDEYTFDVSFISEGDLYYIQTKEGQSVGENVYGTYDDYTVYFFDADTLTLYYIHNNI